MFSEKATALTTGVIGSVATGATPEIMDTVLNTAEAATASGGVLSAVIQVIIAGVTLFKLLKKNKQSKTSN